MTDYRIVWEMDLWELLWGIIMAVLQWDDLRTVGNAVPHSYYPSFLIGDVL